MNETVDDLTIEYEDSGIVLVKEVDKVPLSKGAWATILFRYQEWRPDTGDYGPDKFSIQRFKKTGGEYKRHSKFNISSVDQARKIIDALQRWLPKD